MPLIHANSIRIPIADETIQCVVTSPPYWGLRIYQGIEPTVWPAVEYQPMVGLPPVSIPEMECCLGLEETVEAFVGHLVLICREVRRVLRKDGTFWLNLGDCYAGSQKGRSGDKAYGGPIQQHNKGSIGLPVLNYGELRPKNLVGVPWRVAFALQADGWYLRSDIIWAKRGGMPESVLDRPTVMHEYLFLLAKSRKYYYDKDAISEPAKSYKTETEQTARRNKRSVWFISNKPYKGAHFATFPPDLVEPCVLAGAPEGALVLDPFCGSGTVGEVCRKLNRRFIGLDLSWTYLSELATVRAEGRTPEARLAELPLWKESAKEEVR